MEPPTVEIVQPEDGLEVEAGADVNLRAIVDDNYGGFGWQFTVEKDGEVIYDAPDYERDVDPEYRAALNFTNLEAGVYVLTVTAQDHYEQVTTDSVTLYVGGAQGGDSGGSADSTGGDSGEGGEDSGAAEGGTGGADDGGGDDGSDDGAGEGGGAAGEDSGCACHASGSGPGALPLMLGLGLWWMRRRPAQA
jgi:MYXO-CTERM domain-containing protein